jgi:hypothetical protein
VRQERFIGRPIPFQIENHKLLPLRGNQFFDAVQQFEGIVFAIPNLCGIHGFRHGRVALSQKLLGFLASHSGAPIVKPINGCHELGSP